MMPPTVTYERLGLSWLRTDSGGPLWAAGPDDTTPAHIGPYVRGCDYCRLATYHTEAAHAARLVPDS